MSTQPQTILYCRCAYAQVVPDEVKEDVLRRLTEADVPFQCVSDLCEMSARRDPLLQELSASASEGTLRIAACYPRAVKWLFHAAGCPLPSSEDSVEILNMREESAEKIASQLLGEDTTPGSS